MLTSRAARPASDQPEPLGSRFHHLLGATGASNLSDGLLGVGVPLLAVTWTRDPGRIGLLTTALYLPWLLLAAHVGVLLDRHDRVRLLLGATAARTALLLAVAVAGATGVLTFPVLLGALLLYGVTEVVADSASQVLVPAVAPRTRLGAANGRVVGVQQVMNSFVGGPLAGPLVALGAGWLFGVPAALAGLAAVLVLRGLRGRVPHEPAPATRVRGRTWAELVEGLRYVRGHAVVGPLVVGGAVLNLASAAYFSVFVLWVVGPGSRVGLDPEVYGVLLAGLAVGAVAGALASERLARRLSEMTLLGGAWFANTALLAVPLLVPRAWALAAAVLLVGFSNTVGNVVGQSMRQRLVPSRVLGRVGGVTRTLSFGGMPIGAAVGGFVGQLAGLPAVLGGAVVVSLAAVVWVVRTVPQRVLDAADAALEAEQADEQAEPAGAEDAVAREAGAVSLGAAR